MRQIRNIKDVNGDRKRISEIRESYYEGILSNTAKRFSPLQKLNSLLNTYRDYPDQLKVIEWCIRHFKLLVNASPQVQQQIIRIFDRRNFTTLIYNLKSDDARNFSKNLLDAFCYKEFRQTLLLDLSKSLNIKVCPYCNSQYTLFIEKKVNNQKLADFQFDHFFPKGKYPYLSISFFNLIPSCSICNLRKSSNARFDLDNFVHPYLESFSDLTKFEVKDKQMVKLLMANRIKADKLDIIMTNKNNPKVANYNDTFNLEDIYSRHKDIVQEIYTKAYAYNKKNKESLLKWKSHDGSFIFKDKLELERMILGNYNLEEDLDKRPLSKFMQDIAKTAGLID